MRNSRNGSAPTMKKALARFSSLALVAAFAAQPAHSLEFPKVDVPDFFGGSKDGQQAPGATADCPVIVIEDGAQMLRSPENADAAAVHHQVSIKTSARECIVEGGNLTIRVGLEGDTMLGPVGAPGAYGGTVRVALRRTKDDSIVTTKNYRVGATIPAGAARADFRLLADPISVPFTGKPHDDYEILLGFTKGGADVSDKPARKKKKGRR
jgi:hypothetical protein